MSLVRFATRWNLDAIEAAYRRWQKDPASVDDSWRLFFEGFELGSDGAHPLSAAGGDAPGSSRRRPPHSAYRDLGHFLARLDPLGEPRKSHPQLELAAFGLDDADLDRTFHASNFLGLPQGKLREILAALKLTYCRTIGVEYTHIQDTAIRRWLQERMEPNLNQPQFSREKKLRILRQLYYAELFERFLHTRYVGQKRFSLEGAETLIPLLEAVVERAPDVGVREMVLGMAHRGRLNVLANLLRKPYEEIFAEFEENYLPEWSDGDGDVKYHLGFSSDRRTSSGGNLHLSLTPNPSHLEAVDPVVEGRPGPSRPVSATANARRDCRCSSTATPPLPDRGWWPRRSTCPVWLATPPAAPSMLSSTTRSVSRRRRPMPAPPFIVPTWPR